MYPVFIKEIKGFFNSLVGYMVIIVFLLLSGLFFWVFPGFSVLEYGYAEFDVLYQTTPYLFLILIPAITMRMIAEEKRTGTIEILFTKPIKDSDVVIGKFLAGSLLLLISILPLWSYYFSLSSISLPEGNVDFAAFLGSYIGLYLTGITFLAIGLFTSSLTDNQIVAFIGSMLLCYAFYEGIGYLASLNLWSGFKDNVETIGMLSHYESLSRGLVDSTDIVYFFIIIVVFLGATYTSLSSRKW